MRVAPSMPRFLAVVLFGVTFGVAAGGDLLRPKNTTTNELGALVDGDRDGAVVNDQRYLGLALGSFFNAVFPTIPIDNFTSELGHHEIIGFARRRPARLVEDVPWSPVQDKFDIPFEDEYKIKIRIWIVVAPFATHKATASAAVVATTEIWTDERLGVAFNEVSIVDATANPDVIPFLDFHCNDAQAMKDVVGYDPDRLNVYYVKTVDYSAGPGTGNGVWCFNSKVIAMGMFTTPNLLAHEIGHGFSLAHTNNVPQYFDTTNVMHNSSSDRRYLTEGQIFRSIFNVDSALNNIYTVREGQVTRDCPFDLSVAKPLCPAEQKRIWSDGPLWPPN